MAKPKSAEEIEQEQALVSLRAETPPTDPDDDEEDDEEAEEQSAPETPPPAATKSQSEQIDLLMQIVKSQQSQIERLIEKSERPRSEEELRAEAVAEGKLPVAAMPAPPLGYQGSAQLPRGVWFMPPSWAIQVEIKLCGCKACSPIRFEHYFCCICRRPDVRGQDNSTRPGFAYRGAKGPRGRKQNSAPGGLWGLNHECCSDTCYIRFQAEMGVVAGQNDAEPLPMIGQADDLSGRVPVALGSD